MTSFSPDNIVEFEEAVITACEEDQHNHKYDYGHKCGLVVRGVFVKYDNYYSLRPEVEMQKYVFEFAKSSRDAPHVPEVYHFFHRDQLMAYVVMEYINTTPIPDLELAPKVALALQWLRNVPAPSDRVYIGSLEEGHARHRVFKDHRAPLPFSSVQALERYLNTVAARLRRRSAIDDVSFLNERLVLTQSDMDESHFGVDDKERPCLLDFRSIGWLPESFASHTMSSIIPFIAAVAQHLDWPPSPNLLTMSRIRGFLGMYADRTLGLNEHGYPETV
ncbi:hypothetical protein Clacol_008584 [Clathrus columnatus]|uniref:Aminoglycoside phosphotransferase domain-containing protein n=1 Tax=Clathrus columnatus TaxID=1419009 RepID=A0AAV5AR21_9AGAM|nr:hypothetical protein Clacol_008584 [Clathrus columnatus]